jgi:hypothetical protein
MSYVETVTRIGGAVEVEIEPYFLGGEHRTIYVNGVARVSIIPQSRGMGIIEGLFEIAVLGGEEIEILETYCTEEKIATLIGQRVLQATL